MPKGPPVDWSLFTGAEEYHPSRQPDDADRRARLGRAIRALAGAEFAGDAAAAAKRVAAHIGHIASYQTHRAPDTSARMRSNQRWILSQSF